VTKSQQEQENLQKELLGVVETLTPAQRRQLLDSEDELGVVEEFVERLEEETLGEDDDGDSDETVAQEDEDQPEERKVRKRTFACRGG
jgi:hypothetical protein